MDFPVLSCYSATEAFENAYNLVSLRGETVLSRIGRVKHITNARITILHPEHGVCLNPTRSLSLRYMLGEIKWYLSGSNRVEDIAKYAKMWNDLTDDGETVNSAYGFRIFHKFGFDQLQYCINKLRRNPFDRQAVIHIKEADNTPTKDTPCTCLIQFTVFQGKLHCHVYMRSNDIWLGLPYDVAFFTTLQQIVAEQVGLPLGEYCHTVGDLHLYEKHWGRPVGAGYGVESHVLFPEGWAFHKEDAKSVERMLEGEEPKNPILNQLWRINNGKSY